MTAKERIKKALRQHGMKIGRIWKGHSPSTRYTGWHRSNGQDWFLGSSAERAIDTIEALAEAREHS